MKNALCLLLLSFSLQREFFYMSIISSRVNRFQIKSVFSIFFSGIKCQSMESIESTAVKKPGETLTLSCCHESGCHSLQLHITHGLHLPSCTAHTHSRPPLHQSHSCHHSLINPDCLTTPAPHSLTHIKAAHKHSPSAKSCFSPG